MSSLDLDRSARLLVTFKATNFAVNFLQDFVLTLRRVMHSFRALRQRGWQFPTREDKSCKGLASISFVADAVDFF